MATEPQNTEESIIIGSYNTSYPLDLHSGLLHNFLSESAAIVQKAIYLNSTTTAAAAAAADTDTTTDTAAATFENLVTFDRSINPNPSTTMPTDVSYNKLGKFRLNLADCITKHIKERLVDELNKPDVYMLIEQSIHVDDTNMAYYGWGNNGNIDMAKYDLSKSKNIPNTDYGILRRIQNINNDKSNPNFLFDCCTKSAHTLQYNVGNQQFNIVYDNVVNTSATGVAEGIAIITNNTKFPFGKMLKWNRNALPIPKKLGYTGNDEVFFYSADLGQIIEDANVKIKDNLPSGGGFLILKGDGPLIPDMGRPIMLTSCLDSGVLHIFIAVHNLNLPQLRAIDATNTQIIKLLENLKNSQSKLNDLTKDLNKDNETNTNKTQIDLQTTVRNTDKLLLTNALQQYPKLGTDPTKRNNEVINKICESLCKGMGDFVTSAFTQLVIADSIVGINTVKVYMGGDFNDPNKILLTQLSQNGIEFTINGTKYKAKFNFADFGKTCCANADSVTVPTSAGTLGGINQDTVERIKKYPADFIKGEKFNFEGDTVSFAIATTDTSTKSVTATPLQGNKNNFSIHQPEYTYTNTNNPLTQTVMPSDHYAVMAQFKYSKQGGKRRNYVKNTGRNALSLRNSLRNSFAKGVRGIKRYNVTRRLDKKKTRTIPHNKTPNKYKKSGNDLRTKKKRRTSRKL